MVMFRTFDVNLAVMILSAIGSNSMILFAASFERSPTPCVCASSLSFSEYKSVSPELVITFPKVFHLLSQTPIMLSLYLLISWASCASFPDWYSVLAFQHPILTFDLNCSRRYLPWASCRLSPKGFIRNLSRTACFA